VNGVKFWCYHAGHVLGAAMFMIEIAGVKVTQTKHNDSRSAIVDECLVLFSRFSTQATFLGKKIDI
jgi:Cft2 family RNA processing exonuclease